MSEVATAASQQTDAGSQIRPLSVRMTDSTRAQLDIIAQLNNRSVTDEIRYALEHWIDKSRTDPKVLARAAQVRAEIERDSATKQGAIAAIFDAPTTAKDKRPATPPVASSARGAKPTDT
jgi:predicted transcriptional regulator